MNLNQLAVEICKKEAGKINLTIGQVREVIKCFFEVTVEQMDTHDAILFFMSNRHQYRNKMIKKKK